MSIEKLITDRLLKEQEDRNNREKSGKFSPSLFGYCLRRQFWNRKKEKPTNPPDIRLLKIFKVGKLYHDYVQSFIPVEDIEKKIETEDVLGYADVVTNDSICDIKSAHSGSFHYLYAKDFDITKEKYCNILQVCAYAYFLGKPKATLYFISRDDLRSEEFEFNVEEWKPEIEKELKNLRYYWSKDLLPPPIPRAFINKKTNIPKECDYCQYKDKCKEVK